MTGDPPRVATTEDDHVATPGAGSTSGGLLLVIGVGTCAGAEAAEVGTLIDAVLAAAALSPRAVRAMATVDSKIHEPGIRKVADQRGWPLLGYPAATLAAVAVPNPSEAARSGVGTPSVAEAAALHAARELGGPARLVVQKRKSAQVTTAVAAVPQVTGDGMNSGKVLGITTDGATAPRACHPGQPEAVMTTKEER
ncbi:cobalamin biosynthesis protein [Actinomadura hibisca]|uniref:cobalamin biosynthesis protein n=1 Tax=Actinomadura hibisca TaxID=68565 RepID=UPI00082FA845|nr:cobalamin biosynthesis protein [Actinomadura hibisca]